MAFKLMYWSLSLLFVFTLGLSLEHRAYAYTDPGTCLMLYQSAGAIVSGALFYFRRRLKRLFARPEPKQALNAPAIMSRVDS